MKLGLRAIPALASKMEEWSSPFRSEETMSSSVKARMPNFFFFGVSGNPCHQLERVSYP